MSLISTELNSMLNTVVGKCFAINRMMDRGISLLGVRWNLECTAKAIHEPVAHKYSGELADGVSTYQAKRGNETIYPRTPDGNKDYKTPYDFFADYHSENIDLENLIKRTIQRADKDGDYTTKIFLDGMLTRVSDFTELSDRLVKLFGLYKDDMGKTFKLDNVITKYIDIK